MAHQAHTQREAAGLQAPTPTPTPSNQNYKNKKKNLKLKKKHVLQEELNFLV